MPEHGIYKTRPREMMMAARAGFVIGDEQGFFRHRLFADMDKTEK